MILPALSSVILLLPISVPQAPADDTLAQQLETLSGLHDRGILTPEDYEAAKKRLFRPQGLEWPGEAESAESDAPPTPMDARPHASVEPAPPVPVLSTPLSRPIPVVPDILPALSYSYLDLSLGSGNIDEDDASFSVLEGNSNTATWGYTFDERYHGTIHLGEALFENRVSGLKLAALSLGASVGMHHSFHERLSVHGDVGLISVSWDDPEDGSPYPESRISFTLGGGLRFAATERIGLGYSLSHQSKWDSTGTLLMGTLAISDRVRLTLAQSRIAGFDLTMVGLRFQF